MIIIARPHHILDIMKLYGGGREHFEPDLAYGHDFYKVGNNILAHPHATLKFVVSCDDICGPCKFFSTDGCTDSVGNNPYEFQSKEVWNNIIDKRLLDALKIKQGDTMTVIDYCILSRDELNPTVIANIWRERPKRETDQRAELLMIGLSKYVETNLRDYATASQGS